MVSEASCRCRLVNIVPLAGFSDALSATVWSEHIRQLGDIHTIVDTSGEC